MKDNKNIEFYKQTSLYTDLGLYKDFAKSLTNDIDELCLLQRKQIIHPIVLKNEELRKKSKSFWGDMTKVSVTRMNFEDDLFPTAISMISELLRKDQNYSIERKAEDKIHITCRGQAILLASILKAKGYPARVRCGFASYVNNDGINYDHWITEYYDYNKERWVLVDPDMHCPKYPVSFDLNDIPRDKFIFGANAYLGLRKGKYNSDEFYYASKPPIFGLQAAIILLFYDFHCLMNDEIIFLHLPRYIREKKFKLTEEEYQELDELAYLLLDSDRNFDKLLDVWENKLKFRIMSGALNA